MTTMHICHLHQHNIYIMVLTSMTKVRILADSNKHLKLHAAESLSKLAKYKKVFDDDDDGRKIVCFAG